MENLSRELFPITKRPEKVLQFGEGAFLRAFADYIFDVLIEKELFDGSITVVQPLPEGTLPFLALQDGLYTLLVKGLNNGGEINEKRIISCIQNYINPYEDYESYLNCARNPVLRYIISNTTEAGIRYEEGNFLSQKPPQSFPGKITAFLYERYKHFNGDIAKGLVFLPCELIENNGMNLRKIILLYADEWGLDKAFGDWVVKANTFCDTLVDRITTGFPANEAQEIYTELGYHDKLLDISEPFYFWAIEGPAWLKDELRFHEAGLNVIITDDISQYKTRKVRLLNGAHTASVPAALLCGLSTVGEMMADEDLNKYLHKALFEELIPSFPIPTDELKDFASAVLDRFANPYVRHELKSIMLNSVSKFEVRVLPAIYDYYFKFSSLPKLLTFSLAALITYYQTEDDNEALKALDELINKMTETAGDFKAEVKNYLDEISQAGIRETLREYI
ncbi:MAG: tagaturonate reductase [Lachnospiraceae bacterium]|nr:tagaturonate reductase [Lachnospiraceae bacterium]